MHSRGGYRRNKPEEPDWRSRESRGHEWFTKMKSEKEKKQTMKKYCQRCHGTDHFTYECKHEQIYLQRPSETQQLKHPKLVQPLSLETPPDLAEKREKENKKLLEESSKLLKEKESYSSYSYSYSYSDEPQKEGKGESYSYSYSYSYSDSEVEPEVKSEVKSEVKPEKPKESKKEKEAFNIINKKRAPSFNKYDKKRHAKESNPSSSEGSSYSYSYSYSESDTDRPEKEKKVEKPKEEEKDRKRPREGEKPLLKKRARYSSSSESSD